MNRHELDAEAALREVARRNHISVDEVRKEIKLAMLAAMCSSDPAIQKKWKDIPYEGDTITPEDLIRYIAKRVQERYAEK